MKKKLLAMLASILGLGFIVTLICVGVAFFQVQNIAQTHQEFEDINNQLRTTLTQYQIERQADLETLNQLQLRVKQLQENEEIDTKIADEIQALLSKLQHNAQLTEIPPESLVPFTPEIKTGMTSGILIFIVLVTLIAAITLLVTAYSWLQEQGQNHRKQLRQARESSRIETLISVAKALITEQDMITDLIVWLQEYHQLRQELVEPVPCETLVSTVKALVKDKEIIAKLADWLDKYQQKSVSLDEAARINSYIVEQLIRQIRLRPILHTGDLVEYNPMFHIADDEELLIGEESSVKEPGWQVGSETIKKPIVGRSK